MGGPGSVPIRETEKVRKEVRREPEEEKIIKNGGPDSIWRKPEPEMV